MSLGGDVPRETDPHEGSHEESHDAAADSAPSWSTAAEGLTGRVTGVVPFLPDGSVDVAGHVRALRGIDCSGLLDLAAGCERAMAYLAWLSSKAVVEALEQVTDTVIEAARRDHDDRDRGGDRGGGGGDGPTGFEDPRGFGHLEVPVLGEDRTRQQVRWQRSALVAEAALVCGVSEHTVWHRVATCPRSFETPHSC